jgi:hypothetical protein
LTSQLATPLHIVESYFDIKLERSALKRFNSVSEDTWIDFAQQYLKTMEAHFVDQFLTAPNKDGASLRLYFEPRMTHDWDAAVRHLHSPTPLLGLSPDPGMTEITRDDVSQMLTPLKKHLLIADSVYVRDSFHYCFDIVAETVDETRWREDPNAVRLVHESIRKLKQWLPILVELRGLIESRALVFMPYYVTPSFPFSGDSPALKSALQKVKLRPRPATESDPPAPVHINFKDFDKEPVLSPRKGQDAARQPGGDYFDHQTEVLGAWLNSRLLGLDPVFPNRTMFDWAADLYFDEGLGPTALTSDLISIDILPFGRAEGVGLDDLVKIRKDHDVFNNIREAVVACKEFLEKDIGAGSTRDGVSKSCRAFLDEQLDQCERKKLLRFIEDKPVAGVAFSIAIGAALLPVAPVAPALAVIGGAVLTPKLGLLAERRLDPKRRAIGQLQALL